MEGGGGRGGGVTESRRSAGSRAARPASVTPLPDSRSSRRRVALRRGGPGVTPLRARRYAAATPRRRDDAEGADGRGIWGTRSLTGRRRGRRRAQECEPGARARVAGKASVSLVHRHVVSLPIALRPARLLRHSRSGCGPRPCSGP